MKNFSSLLSFVLALSFVFLSCKKNSEVAATQTDLLTTAAWKVDDIGLDQNKDGNIDPSGTNFYPCVKDNIILFNKNNTGTTDEGATKCYPFDPQTSVIDWGFFDAETNLVINVTTTSSVALMNGKSKIIGLSATELMLSKDSSIGGLTGPYIIKLKH